MVHEFIAIISILLFKAFVSSLSERIINLSNYPYPKPLSSPFVERIAVLGTNDIHGHILPTIQFNPSTNQTYRTGGLTLLSSYIDALKEEWGDNLLWLDAGDEFQGTTESNDYFGESVVEFFNYKNLTGKLGAAIGNHDFDFGLANMSDQFSRAKYPHLAANIFNLTDKAPWNFTNTFQHKIFQVGRLKIGVIGLTTVNTPHTTSSNITELLFQDHLNITIQQSNALRQQGVNIVLLVAHVGVICTTGDLNENNFLTIRKKSTKAGTVCSKNDELFVFLSKLPEGTVDGVIGGHKHTIVHHWINGIPVAIGDSNSKHFNVMYITYDLISRKVVSESTKIEGPVPVCETVSNLENTCYPMHVELLLDRNISYYNFSFHNKIIEEDLILKDILHPYLERAESLKSNVLGYIANRMMRNKEEESEIGNFVADAIKNHTKSDVVFFNGGSIRIDWQQGFFSYYELYETFPFEDKIVTFEATGEELITIIKILQGGYLGFYMSSGLKQIVCSDPHSLFSLRLESGEEINPKNIYKISTINFILMGGDDFKDVLTQFTPKNVMYNGNLREIIREKIEEMKVLNADGSRFSNPNNKRLIVYDCKKLAMYSNYKEVFE